MCTANTSKVHKSKPVIDDANEWCGGWICPCGRYYANSYYAEHEHMAREITSGKYGGYELEESGWCHLTAGGKPFMSERCALTQAQRDTLFDIAVSNPDSDASDMILFRIGKEE